MKNANVRVSTVNNAQHKTTPVPAICNDRRGNFLNLNGNNVYPKQNFRSYGIGKADKSLTLDEVMEALN